MALDPARTVAELRELAELTGDEHGAQRVAFTDTWAQAREWLGEKLAELPVEVTVDAAGNRWATLRGESERSVLLGGHIDSVPDGGWLDGSLNVMAGLEVLRRLAEDGTPPLTVRLVDWADEEGARFGRSLFGSGAASGSIAPDDVRELRDATGVALPQALAEHGIELDRVQDSRRELENAVAYLELHIEQGPVLEGLDLPLGAVVGCSGVERTAVTFVGQAAHAGSTPMAVRRDPVAAAARFLLEVREIATAGGGVGTVGRVLTRPGIVTAIAGECELTLDQRHIELDPLMTMARQAREAAERIAEEERVELRWDTVWHIDPVPFDPDLVDLADEVVGQLAGRSHRLPSGPLHDAAEASRAGIPTVMLFVQSLRGLSHTPLEDTRPEHLELSVQALDALTARTLEWAGRR